MIRPTVEVVLQCAQRLDLLRLATEMSRLICTTLSASDLDQDLVDNVELAVSEACTNAMRHSRTGDANARMIVRFELYEDRLVVEVRDQGAGFDLDKVPPPNFREHPDGGYGLYLMRTIMDEVFYTRGSEYNTLTMKKYFRKEGPFLS